MAITTLDGALAGMQIPKPLTKVGLATAAVGAMRGYTPWYVAGNPGAATASSDGINGAAVTGNAVAGQIPRTNPSSANAYLARFSMNASTAGTMWLIDRLWPPPSHLPKAAPQSTRFFPGIDDAKTAVEQALQDL